MRAGCLALATALVASVGACSTAHADEWTGRDKGKHAAVGAAIGVGFTLYRKDPYQGCATAALVGAAKEVYDRMGQGDPSFKDFAVTAAAGCAAAYTTSFIVLPRKGGATVAYIKAF